MHPFSKRKTLHTRLQITDGLHSDLWGHILALIDKGTAASSVGGDDHYGGKGQKMQGAMLIGPNQHHCHRKVLYWPLVI